MAQETSNIRGQLTVTIIQAKNFDKCDPYFLLNVGDKQAKSSRKNSVTEGKWDEKLSVDLDGSEFNVEIVLMDWDRITSDDREDTTGKIPLTEFVSKYNGKESLWIKMEKGALVKIEVNLTD